MASLEMRDEFILNMTSDAKVRKIVRRIADLSLARTEAPAMDGILEAMSSSRYDAVPFLPFSIYIITGTAGAGKSTCISALYQNLNCLISGATTVAAQNLSRVIKCHCPTIFNAFRFKGKHINVPLNHIEACHQDESSTMETLQLRDLIKYWPIINDICGEFSRVKAQGEYSSISGMMTDMYMSLGAPTLWSSNIVVIDEAGTLSSYILSAVVFFYWYFNYWLDTPLYRDGLIPCIVCVGSPTQTTAFESKFDHVKQKFNISRCDDILSFLISNSIIGEYADVPRNWALFINNKRCLDAEFGHLLKILEYNLEIPDEVMDYVNRFVVPQSRILDPLEFVGWTRLFVSHAEVQKYISVLHTTLAAVRESDSAKLFTCPIICEIYKEPFEEYKSSVNLNITAIEWLNKNLNRLSNYSQFVDQDMVASNVENTDASTKVTYLTKFVKDSAVSLNGKTKTCIFGYLGSLANFVSVLKNETFIDAHSRDRPEQAYHLLNLLMYNGMYFFFREGIERQDASYLERLRALSIPANLTRSGDPPGEVDAYRDNFYEVSRFPPYPSSSNNQAIYCYYASIRDCFLSRVALMGEVYGQSAVSGSEFKTFTSNVKILNGIEYVSDADISGVIEFATSVGHYSIGGYTHSNIRFGSFQNGAVPPRSEMPAVVLRDEMGFISCLENNITKLKETIEDGSTFHLCSVVDYGISSKLAMTIVKSQGISLNKVAISFGNHANVKKNLIYVAISRTINPQYLVMDKNPLQVARAEDGMEATKHIISALNNPTTLLVY